MNCAFVGAGAVAEKYAAGLADSPLRLRAVCDRVEARATAVAEAHDATAYTDLDTMLAEEDAGVVVNLTSHAAHAPVTEQCLRAGRHVFSEKPLALEPERAADLVELASRNELALDCAPINHRCDAQTHARTLLADERLGPVRVAYATAHVGRVTEWHDRPDSFLSVGPLYDGAVYPLSLLVSWFGPVARVRRADALDVWPDEASQPSRPPHVETTLAFEAGPVVSLRASFYVDHRSRSFYGLELHGDEGTLFLDDTGALAAERDAVTVRGGERDSTVAPHPQPRRERRHLAGVERLARNVERGSVSREGAKRAAHVVAICAAVETAAETGGSVAVGNDDVHGRQWSPPAVRPPRHRPEQSAIRLPPVGFGCSRYRNGEYVDRTASMGWALDAGYRLFDSAELYGNEARLGTLLDAPGAPARDSLFVLGKPWNTNHGPAHLREACVGSLSELGIDAFDCYALHWPEAWEHRGSLERLADRPIDDQERLTFPTDESGEPARAPHTLTETWRRLEALRDEGMTRTLGVCNVTLPQLTRLVDDARVPPALVQVERHPYRPRTALVDWCHERGIRVVAHSPLSAPGLLSDDVVVDVAASVDASPAEVVLAWNVQRGVVPIPSSNSRDHVVSNLAAARLRLDDAMLARLDALEDPNFSR